MVTLGILQCMAIGWIYEVKDIKDKVNPVSIAVFTGSFWFIIIVLPAVSLFSYNDYAWTTRIIEVCMLPIITVGSWLFSREQTFKEWFNIVFFSGARKIARHMTLLSNPERKDHSERSWWEPIFEIWWCFSIKFLMPAVLCYGMINAFRTDILDRYGGYKIGVQFLGWAIVIFSYLLIIVPIFLCTKWEPFSYDVDQPFDLMAKKHFSDRELKRRQEKETEMKRIDVANSARETDRSNIDRSNRTILETENRMNKGDEED